jgi:CRISPR-associated endonuclease/helicase Cas3
LNRLSASHITATATANQNHGQTQFPLAIQSPTWFIPKDIPMSPAPTPFHTFFRDKTRTGEPYGYQCRLACGPAARRDMPESLLSGTPCQSQLISIPTGLGKTAAVVLAWLWNRVHLQRPDWPRRLVYCLPMRTLVEQTEENVRRWLGSDAWDGNPNTRAGKVGVHILMGGEDAGEWDIYPEENAILIGTQDMLLSRALNRGYGMSRYRWPMHFGLLNNDCLWVMDETQLMGVGVETSAQLDGFRHSGKVPVVGPCPTWWMSATLDDSRLATVDHKQTLSTIALSDAERSSGRPKELIAAPKKLSPAPVALTPETKIDYARQLAALVKEHHQSGTLTLVIVNRVARAREVYEALTSAGKKGKQAPLYPPERVALIHSRFRRKDREKHEKLLFGEGDRIVIATQAVEAGVDVSARLLITELAPWSSLIQRMGRCNRYADFADAEVLWVDIAPDAKGELLLPYEQETLQKARTAITSITDVSPLALRGVTVAEDKLIRPVIRRRDVVDLFDTTPDICGQDLDVSRYIRDGDDSDVQFFWRDLVGDSPTGNEPLPAREELCRVSIGDAAKFFGKDKTSAWLWNPLDEKWQTANKPRPGGVYLISATSGGYDDALGWTGEPKSNQLTILRPPERSKEGHDRDADTFVSSWQTLAEHTVEVVTLTDNLTTTLVPEMAEALHAAALWHDIGKAHAEFQNMLRNGDASREGTIWAKSAHREGKCSRRGFRHELASALAWLLAGPPDATERDLVAYIIAAHHGKVRLSIRSLPNEPTPEGDDRLFARGVWQGDKLPAFPLGEISFPGVTLSLSFMQMGEGQHGPSWLARAIALRERLGPFRLAFLENLLRAADARASRQTQAD